jgi:hypothetical protein
MGLINALSGLAGQVTQTPNAVQNAQTTNNQNIGNQQTIAQTGLQQAATASQQNDLFQKQNALKINMLAGLNRLPPDQFGQARDNIVSVINRLPGGMQIDPNIDQTQINALVNQQIPASSQPEYQMAQAKAQFYNNLVNGGQGGTQPQSAQQGGSFGGLGMSPNQQAGLAIFDPAGSQALTAQQKLQYESPEGQEKIAESKKQGETIAEANKGVAGIDSRLQNAINILDDQINLAPKTFSGKLGEYQLEIERNAANLGMHPQGPIDQQKFEQNNANLFTQELPAILSSIPGARLDIPLVNAIKKASSIDEFGTPEEKIAAAQNLKGLLLKYQQNTHSYAANVGGGTTPIPSFSDKNPPQAQGAAAQAQSRIGTQPVTPQLKAGSTIYKGHIYLGGDPSNPTSWKSVSGGASGQY